MYFGGMVDEWLCMEYVIDEDLDLIPNHYSPGVHMVKKYTW